MATMKTSVSSMEDILAAMPAVRKAMREDIAKRIAAGENIGYVEDDKVMIGGRAVADLGERKAELVDFLAPRESKHRKHAA